MKNRLMSLAGALAIGILLIGFMAACSKHQAQRKQTQTSESRPPHSNANNSLADLPPPPPVEEPATVAPPLPVKPAPMQTAVRIPVPTEEEVEESVSDRYYDNDDIEPVEPPAFSEVEKKEEVRRDMEERLRETQSRIKEMENAERRREADRQRLMQDAKRLEERTQLAELERQRREAEEQKRQQEKTAASAMADIKRLQLEMERKRVDVERMEKEQARVASQNEAAEIDKLKKELETLKRKKEEIQANKPVEPVGREDYAHIEENHFTSPLTEPLSTFSIDVDKASYANTRRYLNSGSLPPAGAVRIEELVNYFHYDYRQPFSSQPFAFHTEASSCPWNSDHQLVHIGLKGREIDRSEMPASNLVFLIDVSGSMNNSNKLPLLKQAFSLLIDNLNGQDRVAIVVYAGAAGVVLPSTSAAQKGKILSALNNLNAGGSTAGGAGIQLAYQIARNHFINEGNNRVILATDGDFNVGPSSESALIKLIESKRKEGVFLSVLGFGTGNYQDRRMEQLADHGNGNYAYIDNLQEAQKVLVNEMGGTLHTIAKDVKIQIEFNPTYVKAYRLIGYENRKMAAQDFNDDTKDAGELGAGHTVTALYEIVPHSANTPVAGIDPLKYQQITPTNLSTGAELMTIKFRYKEPTGSTSKLLSEVVKTSETTLSATSDNHRFSAAVAAFGMVLRGSRYSGDADYDMIYQMAQGALGKDYYGYRAEFLQLIQRAKMLDNREAITKN